MQSLYRSPDFSSSLRVPLAWLFVLIKMYEMTMYTIKVVDCDDKPTDTNYYRLCFPFIVKHLTAKEPDVSGTLLTDCYNLQGMGD